LISVHRFGIDKGRRVAVQFNGADIAPMAWRQRLGWNYLWLGRQQRAYTDDDYFYRARRMAVSCPVYFGQQTISSDLNTRQAQPGPVH
jgi:hypothetical protein